MQTIQLPDTTPEPGPGRVALTALARRGSCSPALLRAVARSEPRERVVVPSFQSCV